MRTTATEGSTEEPLPVVLNGNPITYFEIKSVLHNVKEETKVRSSGRGKGTGVGVWIK